MSRVRYEVLCGGRLLKVYDQVNVTELARGAPRDGVEFVDGQHWWVIDEQRVADDVAQAMLAKWYERDPGALGRPAPGLSS